ncbi:predicted protein [Naegleria gruberi]|uniref:Predicted protein n=1 Tax=Naegleria gruberi TaxID=5762 RepID=D2V4L8_NAEGR|nr:uncharacterized protein NAEGRDRAFT_63837 [Naegleria gruberi]EFC48123.1 predicted protein [Naegleria gruberi]|eukprot:XP_002680867.1 predicted protein [Naegleria gruberi strain NEG-M]
MQDLKNNSIIVGAFNYYSIFVWRKFVYPNGIIENTNPFSLDDLIGRVSNNSQDFTKFYSTNGQPFGKTRKFKILCPQLYPCQKIWSSLTTNYNKTWIDQNFVVESRSSFYPDCIYGSSLELGDALLLNSFDFAFYVRVNQFVTRKGLFYGMGTTPSSDGTYYNPTDFVPIPLFPSQVLVNSIDGSGSLFSSQINMRNFTNVTDCSLSRYHDTYVLDTLHGVVNFTHTEIDLLESVQSIKLQRDWSFIESYLTLNNSLDQFNQTQVSNLLYNSTCHCCTTTTCAAENIDIGDYLLFIIIVPVFFYFVILFGFSLYKTPSVRTRLATIYISPIVVVFVELLFSTMVRNYCRSVLLPLTLLFTGYAGSAYLLMVVRFLYIKNLYRIIKNSKNPRFARWLASEKVGWGIVLILPLFLQFIFVAPSIIAAAVDFNNLVVFNNIYFVVLAALAIVLALLYSAIDAILNWKEIKEQGLQKYFFFADPAHIRLDMMALFVQVILAIILVILTPANQTQLGSNIVRFIIAVWLLAVSGGIAMTIEIVNKIKARRFKRTNRSSVEREQNLFEHLLTNNPSFSTLFKEYSYYETSLENCNLFDKLLEIKKAGFATMEQLEHIESNFIRMYSPNEVNIHHKSKARFYELLDQIREKKAEKFSVSGSEIDKQVEALWHQLTSDMLYNMWDTYGRLQTTQQYRNWLIVYEVHSKQALTTEPQEETENKTI